MEQETTKDLLAHTTQDGRIQLLTEHLANTARLCASFTSKFTRQETGQTLGEYHDIGKTDDRFQRRIRGEDIMVDHSSCGAECLLHRHHVLEAMCVAGHHAGLDNLGTQTDQTSGFIARMKRNEINAVQFNSAERLLNLKPAGPSCEFKQDPNKEFRTCFLTRMLFSALTDSDFLDTEEFMIGKARQNDFAPLPSLYTKFQKHTDSMIQATDKSEINKIRTRFLTEAIAKADLSQGYFTLSLPTGGGKTLTSMAFALKHAKTHPKIERIIYVIPYTSIIDQTATTFEQIFGNQNVLRHYATAYANAEQKDSCEMSELEQQLRLASENWAAPIVVTTTEQFFESLFSNRPGKCRKLHNMANSIIILDEVQTLPANYLTPCLSAIDALVQDYNCSAVYCTATQPAFETIKPQNPRTMVLVTSEEKECFNRCIINIDQTEQEIPDIANKIKQQNQCLCIVNSKRAASELVDCINLPSTIYLTTNLTPVNRQARIALIRAKLQKKEPCIVVATNLIEAGVDLDFPMVYREMAGIDSILQAAGRCNREGKRAKKDCSVNVFRLSHRTKITDLEQRINASLEVLANNPGTPISSEENLHAYFESYYSLKTNLDIKDVMLLSQKFAFSDIARDFKLIENNTHQILVPDDDIGQKMIETLLAGYFPSQGWKAMTNHMVAVYDNTFQELLKKQAIIIIDEDLAILNNPSYYNKEQKGLILSLVLGEGVFIE